MSVSVRSLLVGLALTLAAGCSSGDQGADAAPDASADVATSRRPPTTTTPPNRAPTLRVVPSARAELGQTFSDAIVVADPDGDLPTVRITGDFPSGFAPLVNPRGDITGFEWTPTGAGEWTVGVEASDPSGLVATRELRLVARAPRDGDLMLVIGDSLAAGTGRDRSDYLGPDDCWRAESSAFPSIAFDLLVAAGGLAPDAQYFSGACRGMTAAGLSSDPIVLTDRRARVSGAALSSLEHAVALNPTIVVVTVGVADVGAFTLDELIVADADGEPRTALDRELLDSRLSTVDRELTRVLDELLLRTDARIVVTDHPDPTAFDPHGLERCPGECFREVSATVFGELATTVQRVAAALPPERVSMVGFSSAFAFRGAPNGLGPDAIRELGLGPIGDLVERFTNATSAHCAAGDGPRDTLVSRLDCVHPNDEGHRVLAERVLATLAEI